MIRTVVVEEGAAKVRVGGEELLATPGRKWVDVVAPTAEEMKRLQDRFDLHPLAVEDCLHLDQRPKLEEYPGHLFLVLQSFACEGDDACALKLEELHFFIGPDYLLLVHEGNSTAAEAIWKKVQQDPSNSLARGADFAAYLVADGLVDQAFPILDRLSDELEDLEAQIFEKPDRRQMARIFTLKRTLAQFRRVLSPQRDAVRLLSVPGLPYVQPKTTLYFRNIYDHLARIYEQIDAARDLVGTALDGYLSIVANKTNDVTKQLTIFASIFLPLSFIVGFFGQNFDVLTQPGFFYAMWAMIIGLPAFMLWWFWRRDWL